MKAVQAEIPTYEEWVNLVQMIKLVSRLPFNLHNAWHTVVYQARSSGNSVKFRQLVNFVRIEPKKYKVLKRIQEENINHATGECTWFENKIPKISKNRFLLISKHLI